MVLPLRIKIPCRVLWFNAPKNAVGMETRIPVTKSKVSIDAALAGSLVAAKTIPAKLREGKINLSASWAA